MAATPSPRAAPVGAWSTRPPTTRVSSRFGCDPRADGHSPDERERFKARSAGASPGQCASSRPYTLRKLVTERIDMNQISSTTSHPTTGALLMLTASLAFAGTNVLQSMLSTPAEYGGIGMVSTGMTFWQYLIATIIALPLILRIGV